MSQKRQIFLKRELEILEYECCLKEDESEAQYEEKEQYEAEITELKQKMKKEKAVSEGDLCITCDKMQKYTSSLKKQLNVFAFAKELLTIVSAMRAHSDSASLSSAHSNKSENVRILARFYFHYMDLLL